MSDWYVAPNGTPSGDGSLANPWNMETALGLFNGTAMLIQPSAKIVPGDAVWCRGGAYIPTTDNGFMFGISASNPSQSNPYLNVAPITVRNYNGERATLQGATQAFIFGIYGGNVWYWGIEATCVGAARTANTPGSFGNPLAYGAAIYAPYVKLINCVVHDTAQGFSAYDAAPYLEIHGCISYYNGWGASDRAHGHGFYIQNSTGTKLIGNNIAFNNADEGAQIYGSGGAYLTGITFEDNTLAQNGVLNLEGGDQFQYNLILGGGTLNAANTVRRNTLFYDPTIDPSSHGYNNIGQYDPSSDLDCEDNWFIGGFAPCNVEGTQGPFIYKGNVIVPAAINPLAMVRLGIPPGGNLSGFTWDGNTYYGIAPFFQGTYSFADGSESGNYSDFPTWQKNTGFDATSTLVLAPTGTWIKVTPNAYEQKRATIRIVNWSMATSVAVDLSGILAVGDSYVIQDAQNFYGPAVVSGTYVGVPVPIPMAGLLKASPTGIATPPHTAPLLGTFVVMQPGAANPVSGVVINPVSVSVQIGTTQQFTAVAVGLAGTGIAWSAQVGTITANGLYTAPSTPQADTVTATSTADSTKSATANISVTVAPPAPPPSGGPMTAGERVVVNTATLNVRSGPDATLAPIGAVTSGMLGVAIAASVVGADGSTSFTDVQFDNGLAGFVLTVQLNPSSAPLPGAGHAASLAWTASPTSGVTAYNVYRGAATGGPYAKIGSSASTSYSDTTVVAGTQYFYVVTAVSAGGESVNSNEASGTVPGGTTPPPPPAAPAPPSGLIVTMS